jgi:hypothetical protein
MSDFDLIRLKLTLMNPFEMLFLLGAPGFIVFNAIRPMKLWVFLFLYLLISLLAIPVLVAALVYHFDLVAAWINAVENPPLELQSMLIGDGPKMIVGTFLSFVIAPGYCFIWLLISVPILYFRYKKRKSEQLSPGDAGTRHV